jgi:hypothetical protein
MRELAGLVPCARTLLSTRPAAVHHSVTSRHGLSCALHSLQVRAYCSDGSLLMPLHPPGEVDLWTGPGFSEPLPLETWTEYSQDGEGVRLHVGRHSVVRVGVEAGWGERRPAPLLTCGTFDSVR